jgi:LPXTG-motif cell wall-anchored protein
MIFKKQILFLFSLFVVQFVTAQAGSTIKASVDKNKILIGEPIQLTVEVYLSPESVKKFISIDSIEHFELLEKPIIDSTNKEGGLDIKGVYKITSFDSGHWVIPSFVLSRDVVSDTIPIDVVFSDFDPAQDYHDIKDILEANPAEKKAEWWWYAAGGTLLLALLLFYLFKKKKTIPVPIPKAIINPYEESMKQLEQLQRDKPETKLYYSKLTDIFRLYIFHKKGILSLQKTTDDLVVQLKSLNLNKDQFDKLSQSLRLSDFVKFAKYIPSANDDRNCFDEIKNAIVTIEKTHA